MGGGVAGRGRSPWRRISAVRRGGLGACSPRKYLKNRCSEMRFCAILALLMAESVCRVFQYVCLYS